MAIGFIIIINTSNLKEIYHDKQFCVFKKKTILHDKIMIVHEMESYN